MAQPIEFPLSAALGYKSVKLLRCTQFGAFVYLARAAILEDVDISQADVATLQFYARATPKQWQQTSRVILKALEDALPAVRAAYTLAAEKKARVVAHGKRCFAKGLGIANQKVNREAKARKQSAALLSEQSAAPVPLQPLSSPAKNYTSHDTKLVKAVKINNLAQKTGNKPPSLLHD